MLMCNDNVWVSGGSAMSRVVVDRAGSPHGFASRQPMKRPSQARTATKKHVILFLAANPRDTGRLA
ncbi:MAG TPA: hypothetical protein VHT91_20135, partial [Kofleriaceae bacterium]|nr:hypothetical protein [Kofleriaceae bacterium]